jgi:peptidoglycan-associated lipoprotein
MHVQKVLPILATLAALAFGCSHAQAVKRTPEGPNLAQPALAPPQKAETPAPPQTPAAAQAEDRDNALYFGYNSATLEDDARPRLQRVAAELKHNPKARARIEGNCDERGTNEYNMALGQHRAEAAKRYLETLGVSPTRVKTISFGKERPKYSGHDEESWAKNRRDDVTVK